MNLRTIFNHFGPPQLFLTFSCDDFAQHFADACWSGKPWENTVLFATAFKRRWNHFFNRVIKGRFANLVGGITHYSCVLEEQDRGSPHIHMVLWTGKTSQQLMDIEDLIVASIPQDETLSALMRRLQTYTCSSYCYKGQSNMNSCRFGFPKDVLRSSFVDVSGRHHIQRDAASVQINQYNPYLLYVWKSAMDIQLCFDDKVDFYLAKYLTKQDSTVTIDLGQHYGGGYIPSMGLPFTASWALQTVLISPAQLPYATWSLKHSKAK